MPRRTGSRRDDGERGRCRAIFRLGRVRRRPARSRTAVGDVSAERELPTGGVGSQGRPETKTNEQLLTPTRSRMPDPEGGSVITRARKDENTRRTRFPAARAPVPRPVRRADRTFRAFVLSCFRDEVPAVAGGQRGAEPLPSPCGPPFRGGRAEVGACSPPAPCRLIGFHRLRKQPRIHSQSHSLRDPQIAACLLVALLQIERNDEICAQPERQRRQRLTNGQNVRPRFQDRSFPFLVQRHEVA